MKIHDVAAMKSKVLKTVLAIIAMGLSGGFLATGAGRVLPEGQLPADARLKPLKDLDGYFPFAVPPSKDAWERRAEVVRRKLLVTLGLWPVPSAVDPKAVIHGKLDLDGYSVEKVYFQSAPGFFVTGNLYRPRGRTGKFPGVLCPHGHWNDGRFTDNANIRRDIVEGAERFEVSGRSALQARCVQLARMGCVVFHYDMIGYADSTQIGMEIAHGFSKQRPDMNTEYGWGLFSPQAESHFQSVMGLQTLDSIRSLDFLLSLPEVDPTRIGVTGASGGGTQTFILCGIDPRPTVAFPAVMVGTAMQGGCTCENACGLRVDTGNVEIAGLFAPKPLGTTGADDWTREMPTKGFPELKQLYGMYGKPELVMHRPLNHFGHNYNYVSRGVMYRWMNKHLALGLEEPIVEGDYRLLKKSEMTVWDSAHPAPKGGPDFERNLLKWWNDDAQMQLANASESWDRFKTIYGGAWTTIVGRSVPSKGELSFEQTSKENRSDYLSIAGSLVQQTVHESNPVLFFMPNDDRWNGKVAIWIDVRGKEGLCDERSTSGFEANSTVREWLRQGTAVAGIDLLYQGEFLDGGHVLTQSPKVKNPREAAAYTLGYNPSVCAQRIQDVVKLVSFVKYHDKSPKSIALMGIGGAGKWVAGAASILGGLVDLVVVDTGAFRFTGIQSIRDPDLLPGAAKYGDVLGGLALAAPARLILSGETEESTGWLKQMYNRADAGSKITVLAGKQSLNWHTVSEQLKGTWQ